MQRPTPTREVRAKTQKGPPTWEGAASRLRVSPAERSYVVSDARSERSSEAKRNGYASSATHSVPCLRRIAIPPKRYSACAVSSYRNMWGNLTDFNKSQAGRPPPGTNPRNIHQLLALDLGAYAPIFIAVALTPPTNNGHAGGYLCGFLPCRCPTLTP